jgi:hypothetical protein
MGRNGLKSSLSLKKLIESAASDAAHQAGLTFAGWGKWKDKSGKVTHKTVGNKIVPIGGGASPSPAPAPEKPAPQAAKGGPPEVQKSEPAQEPSTIFTDEKLGKFMKLGNRIATIAQELEQLKTEYGEETQSMLDEFDRTNSKVAETEQFIAKMARRQTLKTTYSYQQGFQFLLEKVNEELKKAGEAALKATEQISYVRGKVAVTKKEPMQDWSQEGDATHYAGQFEREQDPKTISDEAAAKLKKYNDNVDSLLMLMRILTSKSETKLGDRKKA